jgi:hypothetical protein
MTDKLEPIPPVEHHPEPHSFDHLFEDEEDEKTARPIPAIEFEAVQDTPIKSPYLQGGVVFLGSLLVVGGVVWAGCAILGIGQTQSQPVAQAASNVDPFGSKPIICTPEQQQQQLCKLKGHLAFDRQGNEDKEWLNNPKGKGKGKPDGKGAVKITPKATPTINYTPNAASEPRSVSQVPAIPPAPSVPSESIPQYNPISQSTPAAQKPQVDPNARWNQIAAGSIYNVEGAYSSAEPTAAESSSGAQNASWQNIQGVQTNQTAMVSPAPTLGRAIAQGSETTATLVIPVVSGASNQQALMRLDSPLKSEGTVVLPEGTQLVASVESSGGAINLRLSTAYLNGQQISLPTDSIVALATNKKPLIAKNFNGGGGLGRGIRNFGLGLLGGAVDTALGSATTSITNSNGSTTIVNNMQRNLTNTVLGGARGGVQSLIGNIQQNNQSGYSGEPTGGLTAGTRIRLIFVSPASI